MSRQGGFFADQKKRWETPLCKVWNHLETCMAGGGGMIQFVNLALF